MKQFEGDVAVVTHGTVGALLMCSYMRASISCKFDQPAQGHYRALDMASRGRSAAGNRWSEGARTPAKSVEVVRGPVWVARRNRPNLRTYCLTPQNTEHSGQRDRVGCDDAEIL